MIQRRFLTQTTKDIVNKVDHRPWPHLSRPLLNTTVNEVLKSSRERSLNDKYPTVLLTSTIETLNSPQGLVDLYDELTKKNDLNTQDGLDRSVLTAEIMRESAIKTITLNGVAKVINCLNAFSASLPEVVKSNLSTTTHRKITPQNVEKKFENGYALYNEIYQPHSKKLEGVLDITHPDLSTYILQNHYSALLAPPSPDNPIGRVETSLMAIACLRAQGGVNPQLFSHAFGLYKAKEEKFGWIASDDGVRWSIEVVDYIVNQYKNK